MITSKLRDVVNFVIDRKPIRMGSNLSVVPLHLRHGEDGASLWNDVIDGARVRAVLLVQHTNLVCRHQPLRSIGVASLLKGERRILTAVVT